MGRLHYSCCKFPFLEWQYSNLATTMALTFLSRSDTQQHATYGDSRRKDYHCPKNFTRDLSYKAFLITSEVLPSSLIKLFSITKLVTCFHCGKNQHLPSGNLTAKMSSRTLTIVGNPRLIPIRSSLSITG